MYINVRLGRVFGIPVGLHWSWFLVFVLISTSLSVGYFALVIPDQPLAVYWCLGTTTSLLLFISVLIHEFGHALVSVHHGIPVDNITLFLIGGVAQLREEPRTAQEEFQIAIAGPAASLGTAAGEVFDAALRAVLAAARGAGKAAGILTRNREQALEYRHMGFSFLAMGSDRGILAAGMRHNLEAFRQAVAEAGGKG